MMVRNDSGGSGCCVTLPWADSGQALVKNGVCVCAGACMPVLVHCTQTCDYGLRGRFLPLGTLTCLPGHSLTCPSRALSHLSLPDTLTCPSWTLSHCPSRHSLTFPSCATLTCSGDTFHAPLGSAYPRPQVNFVEQIIRHQSSKRCVYGLLFFFSWVPLKIKVLRLSSDVWRDDGCGSSRPPSWGLGHSWAATGPGQCWVKVTFDPGSLLCSFCPASPLHSRADNYEHLTPEAT